MKPGEQQNIRQSDSLVLFHWNRQRPLVAMGRIVETTLLRLRQTFPTFTHGSPALAEDQAGSALDTLLLDGPGQGKPLSTLR